jgi:hypothetical protein
MLFGPQLDISQDEIELFVDVWNNHSVLRWQAMQRRASAA